MNNSGICIRELIEYFKIDAEDVIVFHDDLDVEFGKIKAKFGGSSAGHNGIAVSYTHLTLPTILLV